MNEQLLANLNPAQAEAVRTLHGPLMILAGAGSGKTRVLTRRLAYLVATGNARLDQILAVTFTNKAAREMRERVMELLGLQESEATQLWVGTFHSIGARILRRGGVSLGYQSNFTILDAGEQERLIKRILAELNFEHTYWTPSRLTNSISRWKDDGLGPTDDLKLNPRDRMAVSDLFQRYQTELTRTNCMDFGDLLSNCLKLWRQEPTALEYYQRRFRFILVDEYQDTNAVQYQWLKHLAAEHGNLCVVGDDDQSIYSWRGARLDNILKFRDDFPGVVTVRLEQNYRSTGNILQAASGLINHNLGRMGKQLWTSGEAGSKVVRYQAEDGEDEASYVAHEIARHCRDGGFERCAVLVRASRQTRMVEEALLRQGIPFQVVGGMRFLERLEVKDALGYLRLVGSYRDDLAFERIINIPRRGFGPKALETIRETAAANGLYLLEAARLVVERKLLPPAARQQLAGFIELIANAGIMMEQESPEKVLAYIIAGAGLEAYTKGQENGEERWENLLELRVMLSKFSSLEHFLESAALESDLGQQGEPDARRTVVSTLHAAKGLEFPVVFMVGMEEGTLPNAMALRDDATTGLEEERRLVYVGMTRARERLYLLHARKRWAYGRIEPTIPSRFLDELPAQCIEQVGLRVSVRRGLGKGW